MIENPLPHTWQELQDGVCRLFNEIGLNAEVGKVLHTPRGTVEIDVYAVDENSVDKIRYIVECKNWLTAVPQTVVHSFTTVMHEVGGNIGYIISRKGLQAGAIEYTKSTNIVGLTYEEFQRRYFSMWYERFFVPQIGDIVDALTQYVEPINSRRERHFDELSEEKQVEFRTLLGRYFAFGMSMACFEFPRYMPELAIAVPEDIVKVKSKLAELGDEYKFTSQYFRDLLPEIRQKIIDVTMKFNAVFGRNIFA
ncbi:MAG TPA: restriction endonuclease [Syntrophales bacterium]|nr:restriction endonuclease [Syntrophales bacterium]